MKPSKQNKKAIREALAKLERAKKDKERQAHRDKQVKIHGSFEAWTAFRLKQLVEKPNTLLKLFEKGKD